MAGIELSARADGPGKRGYDVFVKAYENGLMCRLTGDTLALSPPLILNKRSEEHTSELQSLMRISYAVFCLKKKKTHTTKQNQTHYKIHHNNYNIITSHNNTVLYK